MTSYTSAQFTSADDVFSELRKSDNKGLREFGELMEAISPVIHEWVQRRRSDETTTALDMIAHASNVSTSIASTILMSTIPLHLVVSAHVEMMLRMNSNMAAAIKKLNEMQTPVGHA